VQRGRSAEGSGAHAEFRPERAIEVRHVTKSAIESDVDHFPIFRDETRGGGTDPGAPHVLVGGEAGHALECAQEMVRAEISRTRQPSKSEVLIRMTVDHLNRRDDSSLSIQRYAASIR
jgi:hypothetical protein